MATLVGGGYIGNGVVESKNLQLVSSMFSDNKLQGIMGYRKGSDYIEVTCGCTCFKLGDAVGKLRVYTSEEFHITCECNAEHPQGMMTPAVFEKHSRGLSTARNWKENIWVIYEPEHRPKSRKIDGQEKTKFPLSQTGLLKYYMPNNAASTRRLQFHRDEFIRCTLCSKLRRFRLRTDAEFRIYHDAANNAGWKCGDKPYDQITCSDNGERESCMVVRGCPRERKCKGCKSCVCFGCLKCCFSYCNCRACTDFMKNNATENEKEPVKDKRFGITYQRRNKDKSSVITYQRRNISG